jgi:aquaporin Z
MLAPVFALDRMDYARRGVAEFVGTFALIFVGATSGLYNDLVAVALAHGLVIAIFVSAFARVSGGHFNPAVTLGFLVTRRIPAVMAGYYWIVQLSGAAIAALLLKWIFPHTVASSHLGAPAINSAISSGKGVTIEAIGTFFLVFVVFAVAVDAKGVFSSVAGFPIGFTIAIGVLGFGPLTGGAFNPARAFGPELVSNHWKDAWVWYVGPLAGGALAAILYELLYLGRPLHEDIGAPSELYTPEDVAEAIKDPDTDVVIVEEIGDAPENDMSELPDDGELGGGEPPTDARP